MVGSGTLAVSVNWKAREAVPGTHTLLMASKLAVVPELAFEVDHAHNPSVIGVLFCIPTK